MKLAWRQGTQSSLFGKIFVVMVISTIAVAATTSWMTVKVSQNLFLNTFSITNSKIIQQIKRNFETFNYSVVTASNDVMQSGTIKNFLTETSGGSLADVQAYYKMKEQMKHILNGLDLSDVGTVVLGMGDRSYFSDRNYWLSSAASLQSNAITALTVNEAPRLSYHFLRDEKGTAGDPLIVATRALLSRSTKEMYGQLYFMIREHDFQQFYSNFTSTGNDVIIMDRTGLIISSNRQGLIGQRSGDMLARAEEIEKKQLKSSSIKNETADVLMLSEYLPACDFYIVNLVDKKLINKMLPVTWITLICAAIISAALLALFLITRRLTRSLRMLVRQMSSVTKRNFHNYIAITGSYETRELGTAFNYMLDELNNYILQLVATQREQRNAELAALQRQINPHFLYNTLASVNFLVQRGDNAKATETMHALISLLQNSISNVEETISVEQEVLNLKHYAFINQVRYGTGIAVDYFISPDCLEARLPKLILQPFMENAFFHGFKERSAGYIYVIISREGDTLRCEVVDNGDGMDLDGEEDKLPDSNRNRHLFTGIGIRNVHARILLLYGKDFGTTIQSRPGEGTRVTVRLPFRVEEPPAG
ncbi:cache domain-containing sensor histidine kinase [Paenibacillus sacheonensis]|uniref:HAMP domain-containing protein n=1 Tax=Paenibacillus sacheonensis TaxID=742054 RepID=A0A7X5C407_9BACL|nr:histidine kinase [Paenibacillus sacheonensis]MBM7567250.1 two-component system sensor histidine kinase YesM [Paenibacillus sacheonensis]NBC72855.1 HAMP domain-containing protein [Paenibacillus sacheonensis]